MDFSRVMTHIESLGALSAKDPFKAVQNAKSILDLSEKHPEVKQFVIDRSHADTIVNAVKLDQDQEEAVFQAHRAIKLFKKSFNL